MDEYIQHILNTYIAREDSDYFARLVNSSEISSNDYNLSVSSYVEQEDTREKIDIHELNARIEGIVKHQNELRASLDEIIKNLEAEA
jgi:type I restriction enzyme M protein